MRKIFAFFSFITVVLSCSAEISADEGDALPGGLRPYRTEFMSLWNNKHEKDSFIFFTDPHLLSYNNIFTESVKSYLISKFEPVKTLYDNLPLSFCLCGGDWLNSADTQEVAKEKLLWADQQMKGMFTNYHKMFGNHDTNYYGIVSEDNPARGILPRAFVDTEYYSENISAYYSFSVGNSEYYILDSDLDAKTDLYDYRIEQLHWLADQLSNNAKPHIVLGIHMFYSVEPAILPMSEEIASICKAFNTRDKYVLSEREYNYSSAQGTIHLILTGHRHTDFLEYVNGIPVVGTTKFLIDGIPTFEICVLDYDTGYANMIRVGEGNSRQVKMYM